MVILILEQLGVGMQEYYKETCDEMDGTLIFYECQNLLWVTPCSELKTGMWCKLNNGTEIDITIRNIIN